MLVELLFVLVTIVALVAVLAYAGVFAAKQEAVFLPSEAVFLKDVGSPATPFPSLLNTSPDLHLSIIVPAFDEEKRLPIMLDSTLAYVERRRKAEKDFDYEIIVVDDGSKDKTTPVALEYTKKYTSERIRVLKLKKNRGKGGAVKRGMLCARGRYLLMADADGATEIADLDRVEAETKKIERDGLAVGIGSRAHMQQDAVAKRKWYRNILMYGFHTLLGIFGVRGIKDTQCGFKLFSRRAAQLLFPSQHVERWAFDVELILLSQRFGIPMTEVAVNWQEIAGSKLSLFAASVQMARDIIRIRFAYMLGVWTVRSKMG